MKWKWWPICTHSPLIGRIIFDWAPNNQKYNRDGVVIRALETHQSESRGIREKEGEAPVDFAPNQIHERRSEISREQVHWEHEPTETKGRKEVDPIGLIVLFVVAAGGAEGEKERFIQQRDPVEDV